MPQRSTASRPSGPARRTRACRRRLRPGLWMLCVACLATGVIARAAEESAIADAYLEGYIASWLLHEYHLEPSRLWVRAENGIVTLRGVAEGVPIDQIMEAVAGFALVRRVIFVETPPQARGSPGLPPETRWSSWMRWVGPHEGRRIVRFPSGDLFAPPLADQKQPRFHTTYQRYDIEFGEFNLASVGFGENFGLLRAPGLREGDGLQLGISGAVFALFNLDAPSRDLLNADYYVGFPLSWRKGVVSARARLFHLSSHLGDEFLLEPQPVPPVERINLSYEAIELLVSGEHRGLRLYGGGARIVHSDTSLGRDRVQVGIEFRGRPLGQTQVRVIAGLDLQAWDETDWDRDTSLKVGLSLPNPYGGPKSLQLLAEHYDGHVPHGQFFNLEAKYWGIGLAFSL